MTDTLPRTIPTDPAEQEAQMPEWVKVEVCRLWNAANRCENYWISKSVSLRRPEIFAHALTIWQRCPRPVDPDLLMAREIVAELWPSDAKYYSSGQADKINEVRSALAAIKRVRALERGEG